MPKYIQILSLLVFIFVMLALLLELVTMRRELISLRELQRECANMIWRQIMEKDNFVKIGPSQKKIIRESIDICDLVDEYLGGYEVSRRGEMMTTCPECGQKRMIVNKATEKYAPGCFCFGCRKRLDHFGIVMSATKKSFIDAANDLIARCEAMDIDMSPASADEEMPF